MPLEIVLEKRKLEPRDAYRCISDFVFYNPLRDDIYNRTRVFTPDLKIDGLYLIILSNGAGFSISQVQGVIGVVDNFADVERRTYELARKLAEERAKNETYGWYNDKRGVQFTDNTSKPERERLELAVA
ncbi:MAG: hypothetical protein AABX11_02140 [Nanoarchaeota archaeon]